jgi:hypothetical protein
LFGFLQSIVQLKDICQTHMRRKIVWIVTDGLLILCDQLVPAPHGMQELQQIGSRVGEGWVQRQRPPVAGYRFVKTIQSIQRVAQVGMIFCNSRPFSDGLPQKRLGLGIALLNVEDDAEQMTRFGFEFRLVDE